MLKTVVKEGEGWAHPKAKDEVTGASMTDSAQPTTQLLSLCVHGMTCSYFIRLRSSPSYLSGCGWEG